MRRSSSFWLKAGIAIGTITGMISRNIPAAICIGGGSGMLVLLLGMLNIQVKKQKVKI